MIKNNLYASHFKIILSALLIFISINVNAASPTLPLVTVSNGSGGQTYSVSLQILALMTVLTLLPSVFIMMTSFTRIIIVMSILRQAIGMPQTPTNQILIGLSLFLTLFIMAPVLKTVNDQAVQPYLNNKMSGEQAIEIAQKPVKKFMLAQTRSIDLELFAKLSGNKNLKSVEDITLTVLIPAFVTSELKTAFQIGFLLFLPFLIIDLVVASVLMAMGMMMLSPLVISLPFKIMLFVLVDGWSLLMGTLASSFNGM